MDPLRRSSRVLKISQEDIEFNVDQQQLRKFNVTPAPISRPPSSCENRFTKIQKVIPNNIRKRRKWDDRFHIETYEAKQVQSHPTQIYKFNKSQKKQKKQKKQMKQINKYSKTKETHSSSIIPPIDVVTGKREWGKKNKKRAKWSMRKNKSVDNNMNYMNYIVVNNKSKQRAKWNTNKSNPLSKLQRRVLQITPKLIQNENENENENKEETKNKPQILMEQEQEEGEKEKEEEEKENEELHDGEKKSEFDNKRATKRLLPINNKNKEFNHKRKRYLKPLDKVADIILQDLIQNVSEELETFCCEIVDALIHSETNVIKC